MSEILLKALSKIVFHEFELRQTNIWRPKKYRQYTLSGDRGIVVQQLGKKPSATVAYDAGSHLNEVLGPRAIIA